MSLCLQGQIAALSEGRGAANHQPTSTSTAAETVRLILAWNTDSAAAKEKARSEVQTLVGGASVVLKFDQLRSLNMDIITVSRQASDEVLNALKKSPAVSVIGAALMSRDVCGHYSQEWPFSASPSPLLCPFVLMCVRGGHARVCRQG